jgi:hypothetical protein
VRILTIGLLSGVLLAAGCTRQEVNHYSAIPYGEADDAGEIAFKTAGNLIPWVGGAVIYAIGVFAYVASAGGQERVSGSVSTRSFSYSK